MYTVEVFRGGAGLAAPMHQMRTWLDGKGIEPVIFRLSLIPGGTVFRVEFRSVSEAEAFARALAGKVVEPGDHSLAA
jgi:hypothetical protein